MYKSGVGTQGQRLSPTGKNTLLLRTIAYYEQRAIALRAVVALPMLPKEQRSREWRSGCTAACSMSRLPPDSLSLKLRARISYCCKRMANLVRRLRAIVMNEAPATEEICWSAGNFGAPTPPDCWVCATSAKNSRLRSANYVSYTLYCALRLHFTVRILRNDCNRT